MEWVCVVGFLEQLGERKSKLEEELIAAESRHNNEVERLVKAHDTRVNALLSTIEALDTRLTSLEKEKSCVPASRAQPGRLMHVAKP